MSGQLRLLKVVVQPVFVSIDDDGEVEEVQTQPIEVKGKDWRAFADTAFGAEDLAGIAAAYEEARGQGQPSGDSDVAEK